MGDTIMQRDGNDRGPLTTERMPEYHEGFCRGYAKRKEDAAPSVERVVRESHRDGLLLGILIGFALGIAVGSVLASIV